MSPQFVDYDADGILDIVAATFDGSPHLARGSAKGYAQPEQILDRDGARIVMNQFWNRDNKPEKWDDAKRCDPDGEWSGLHLTSAWAVDWDGDGDLDLLLGDHNKGHVMLRRNDGTAKEPKFATKNEVVLANGKPMVVVGTVTTLRTIDWDRDGKKDLLVGSMGDAYGGGPGGGVFLWRNVGDDAAPKFDVPMTLIEASERGATQPTRPDAGLYMDATDADGDGDLDLVVGGYSTWTPPKKELDEAQQKRVAELDQEIASAQKEIRESQLRMAKALEGVDESKQKEAMLEFTKSESDKLAPHRQRLSKARDERDTLVPTMQRRSFTWLYENVTPHSVGR